MCEINVQLRVNAFHVNVEICEACLSEMNAELIAPNCVRSGLKTVNFGYNRFCDDLTSIQGTHSNNNNNNKLFPSVNK